MQKEIALGRSDGRHSGKDQPSQHLLLETVSVSKELEKGQCMDSGE